MIMYLSVASTGLKLSILIEISIFIQTSCCIVVEESLLSIPQLANQLSVVDCVADSGRKTLSNVVKAGGLCVAILILHVFATTGPVLSFIGQVLIPLLERSE